MSSQYGREGGQAVQGAMSICSGQLPPSPSSLMAAAPAPRRTRHGTGRWRGARQKGSRTIACLESNVSASGATCAERSSTPKSGPLSRVPARSPLGKEPAPPPAHPPGGRPSQQSGRFCTWRNSRPSGPLTVVTPSEVSLRYSVRSSDPFSKMSWYLNATWPARATLS